MPIPLAMLCKSAGYGSCACRGGQWMWRIALFAL